MTDATHRTVETNGIRMHAAEQGDGPLVLLCHGFPELWYSWRHQLPALAAAGYHAVAPDLRGYGRTDAPDPVDAYTILHLVGDLVGLLDACDERTAVVVGHDWGAPLAWTAAMLRPDRFRAVVGMSVPWTPRSPMRPTDLMRAVYPDSFFYILYFQEPGVAEAELDPAAGSVQRGFLYTASGDVPPERLHTGSRPPDDGLLPGLVQPDTLPGWLTEDDLAVYTAEFERTGFRGGLNWYRNLDRNWELTAPWADARIHQPALFIGGTRDGVLLMMPGAVEALVDTVPGLRDSVLLEGCGHWTQQERPAEVNEALLAFLAGLPRDATRGWA
ncbi:MAG: alpha/beta hydrolase [Acidimicrobiales bacterium]|nr:alpha/beta hydrolase [Acidimicrobiales bacterium]